MFGFLKGVAQEMRKVSWPTGSELIRKTLIVIGVVGFLMAFIYLIDLGITMGIKYLK